MKSPPIKDEDSPIKETPPFVPCDEGLDDLWRKISRLKKKYHLWDFLEGGYEEGIALGDNWPKLRGPGIAIAAGKGTKHPDAQPRGSITARTEQSERIKVQDLLMAEVDRKVGRPHIKQV